MTREQYHKLLSEGRPPKARGGPPADWAQQMVDSLNYNLQEKGLIQPPALESPSKPTDPQSPKKLMFLISPEGKTKKEISDMMKLVRNHK